MNSEVLMLAIAVICMDLHYRIGNTSLTKLPTLVQDRNLPVIANLPCYANGVDVIYSFWQDTIAKFDGSKPLFLSAQGESWKMGPDNIVALKERLEALSPGNIVYL